MSTKTRHTPRAPRLVVDITKELIDSATAKDSNHCMIADAIKIMRPDATGVSVDLATIRFTDRKKALRYTYLTPRIAQAALVNFDQARPPEPFSFLLRGAQVTRSGRSWRSHEKKERTPAQKTALAKATKTRFGKTRLKGAGTGNVPDRIGGQTPPLQRSRDNVPFSRRRAYGLRALEL